MAQERELKLSFTKDQLGQILKAISPFRADEYIRLSIAKDNVIIETDELGTTCKITLGNADIKAKDIGTQIFINKSLFHSLHSTIDGICELSFKNKDDVWSEVSAVIQGDTINVGLPIFDKELDTSYESNGKSEVILSEIVDKAISATNSAVFKEVSQNGTLALGKEYITGTEVTQAIYTKFFKEMEIFVSPIFKPFLQNLTKIGGTITVTETKDNCVVFKAENTEYKTFKLNSSTDIKEVLEALTQNKLCEFRCGGAEVSKSLDRISIPLFGADSSLFITVKGKTAELEVLDIQNRCSKSEITLAGADGEGRAEVSIKQFSSILSSFNECNVTFYGDEEQPDVTVCVLIEDETHKIYLMANIS